MTINDNHAKVAEALYIAERHAREEVEKRAQMQKKLAEKEKEQKEERLRQLAQKAREERANMTSVPSGETPLPFGDDYASRPRSSEEDDEAFQERERLRRERERDIQREIRMSHMGMEAKSRLAARDLDRDVSEKIALGMAAPSASKELMYDQRLFNQSHGMDSGFKSEDCK